MDKNIAFKEINETQKFYVNKLFKTIISSDNLHFKEVNFTSNTGTGKTKMMAMLINKMPDYYFVVTTLSRGQLSRQIKVNLNKNIKFKNYKVYGNYDYTSKTKLQAKEILKELPINKKIIWLRDEGHINTNKWISMLEDKCFKIINISATNKNSDIKCNFTNTMMLRTVHQEEGSPIDAIKKLIEVKKQHKNIKNYNPCAIMRCLDEEITNECIKICKQYKLKYINLTNNDNYDMSDLCKDDNEYDVIINKFKIVEGIDIRRAHVIYMTNEPSNINTTIQLIGRCRRNALLYRNDINIFSEENKELLKNTRQCFVFFNVVNMKIQKDENGELIGEFCDIISCEKLKPESTIYVENGFLQNGLLIKELEGLTGVFKVLKDKELGFNYVESENKKISIPFYKKEVVDVDDSISFKINYYTRDANKDLLFLSRRQLFDKIVRFWHGYVEINKFRYSFNHKRKIDQLKKEIKNGTIKNIYQNLNTINGDSFTEYIKIPKNLFTPIDGKITISNSIFQKYRSKDAIKYFGDYFFDFEINLDRIFSKRVDFLISSLKKNNISYRLIYNDRQSAIIGFDEMYPIKVKNTKKIIWAENCSMTKKISKYSKITNFISKKYKKEILSVQNKLFKEKNVFTFTTKLNSCLGYCVEYYSKYLLYGWNYIKECIPKACLEFNKSNFANFNHRIPDYLDKAEFNLLPDKIQNYIVVRACEIKYLNLMQQTFGKNVTKVIKTTTMKELISSYGENFIDTVIKLGIKTFNFVKTKLTIDKNVECNPNLSIKHIKGLCDYIDKNTIIDIKVTNCINMQHIFQVLGYHYLSTKRSDLNIKKLIVYDAISNKSVEINI